MGQIVRDEVLKLIGPGFCFLITHLWISIRTTKAEQVKLKCPGETFVSSGL